jgi:hypothetical protein
LRYGAALLICSVPGLAISQIVNDNFDDANISDWEVRNVVQPLGGFVSNQFPPNGTGSAFRIQRGSADMSVLGFPQAYGTGRAWLFRTNEYADFYVAMDLVGWNDNTNQAAVLLARATGYDDTLGDGFPPGLGTVSGYVCNYDNAQDGDGPGDRRGGQFQINTVINEGTRTLCAAEITLKTNKTYRMIFKGQGTSLSAKIYDYEDLSTPLIEIAAVDDTFPSGVCGIVSFHRNDSVHPNLTDMTVDNYYSAPTDPNPTIAPATAHSTVGTPQVTARVPVKRFTNFHPPTAGIGFTAQTLAATQIDAAATRLYLNGVDKSSALAPLPPNGSQAIFITAAGTLASNTVYEARIELQDTTGTMKSTNVFWFDTFSDAHVKSLLTIEAEDYNHSGGSFIAGVIPVSGYDTNGQPVGDGLGYMDLAGVPDIDYYDRRTSTENGWNDYRITDYVGTLQGNREDIEDLLHPGPTTPSYADTTRPNDNTRSQYAAVGMKEYQVARTQAGEWLNYTRAFPEGYYKVYLRAGSFGVQEVELSKVEGDITTTNQTTVPLGVFPIQNQFMRLNYHYTPLMDGASPAVIQLGGTNTLRLTIGGTLTKDDRLLYLNYLLFVPATPSSTLFDTFSDGNDTAAPAWTHYNPIETGSWSFPNGTSYRIQTAPSPDPGILMQGRSGSLAPGEYTDFYVSVDVVGWDDSIQQIVGVFGRLGTPGLGSTTGYLFVHDRGSPTSTTSGDVDIIRLDGEFPTVLENITGDDSFHFETNKTYRMVLIGQGTNFTGKVYELPNTATPVVEVTAADDAYSSGVTGVMVANNAASSGYTGGADATFDNFLVTTAEPRLEATLVQNTLKLSWPVVPFTLQETSTFSTWTAITSGITQEGDMNVYSVPVSSGTRFYRIVYP